MDLSHKTVLITGANGGLGAELLNCALAYNAKHIYCTARNSHTLAPLAQKYPTVKIFQLDITDKHCVDAFAASVGTVDILINNAGINSNQRVTKSVTVDFEINVLGTLNMCQAFKDKINPEGSLVNISSIVALVNLPIMGLYSASKAALHSLTQAFRAELHSKNIWVQEVLPGPINTRMTQGQTMPKASPQAIAKAIFEGIQNKEEEIFPDDFSKMIYANLLQNPKALEKEFAKSIQNLN